MCNVPLHSGVNTCEITVRGLSTIFRWVGGNGFHYAETQVEEFLLALTKYTFSSLILDVPYKFQQVSKVFLNFHNFLTEQRFFRWVGSNGFHYAETQVEEFLLTLTKYTFSSLILDVHCKFQQVSQVFLNFHNFLPETKVFSSSVPQENPQ